MFLILKRSFAYPRKLSDIFHTSSLESLPSEQIMALWNNFHSENHKTATKIISSIQYRIIQSHFLENPSFIFPMKHRQDTITLISELHEDNFFAFSNIEDPDNRLLVILRFFDEVAKEKKIVPIRAEILDEQMKQEQVTDLIQNFVDFYADIDLYSKYVQTFNKDFSNFNYEDFIREYFKIEKNL